MVDFNIITFTFPPMKNSFGTFYSMHTALPYKHYQEKKSRNHFCSLKYCNLTKKTLVKKENFVFLKGSLRQDMRKKGQTIGYFWWIKDYSCLYKPSPTFKVFWTCTIYLRWRCSGEGKLYSPPLSLHAIINWWKSWKCWARGSWCHEMMKLMILLKWSLQPP